MMNVNEQPMDQDEELKDEADDDSELDAGSTPPQSASAPQIQPAVGRSANIGHNTLNPTAK